MSSIYIHKKLVLGVILLTGLICSRLALAESQPTQVLILHSYSPSYQWTADIQRGIEDAVKDAKQSLEFSIEYMDTKRISTQRYENELVAYLKEKYKNKRLDGIIVSDDYAFDFLNRYSEQIFGSIPVVAVGINNEQAELSSFTGPVKVHYEKDNIKENIELIKILKPNLKTLYFLIDESYTSTFIKEEFFKYISEYPSISVEVINNISLTETAEFLSHVDPNDAVLLTHYNTELSDGVFHHYNETAKVLSANSNAPIFVFWQHYLGSGVLGGYVNKSHGLGYQSIVSLGLLLGNTFDGLYDSEHLKGYVFDYAVLDKFHISDELLPVNSKFINKPTSFIESNALILFIAGCIISLLIAIILLQQNSLRRKRELNEKNQHIVELQTHTLSVQKEMIHMLGEAIETRSGETGNHVKRVAKLSALLGELAGLDKQQCDLIEVISPMHDVGKIAVPEAILDKPGKLTAAEWGVMQQHTTAGYKLLVSGQGEIMHYAAQVALQHHERWDGTGYPSGKAGEEIHLFARITAIADVFDALLSERCYKKAWPIEKVIDLYNRECGFQFDPDLTRLMLDNIDRFVAIRNEFPDTVSEFDMKNIDLAESR
ncbi:HD domain-containing protein [Vibrio sp. Of7-15]|uniref:HD domain-containing phosphohydrolase n=1 Tax=Vibrio sp. Of7-15 TaxID=2724879 RepID=UPI001EF2F056|nr:HD domain-containing phosphohydrolase [Vibrio sp. Of7-15]MCG7496476.1 HD domain-containing protein [Vibrio sp. Of7-15]